MDHGVRHGRSRARLVLCLVAVIVLGLGSRRFAGVLPPFVARYAGDTLWATAAFLAAALLFPRAARGRLAAGAALFALAVELSQLAHPPWLQAVRRWPGTGLVLGYDFAWSDLACYAAGVALGACLDRGTAVRRPAPRPADTEA